MSNESTTGERVKQLREHIENGGLPNGVSVNQCKSIRRRYKQSDKSEQDIADEIGLSYNPVHQHIAGKCSHDVEAVETGSSRRHRITDVECRQMQEQYQQSDTTQQDIADDVGFHVSTVGWHLNGRCSHDLDGVKPSPVKSSHTTADECRRMREQYKQSDATQQDIAEDFNMTKPTVRRHIHGKCSHDLDGVKPCPVNSSYTTADECRQMREQYKQSDTTQQEIAEDFNVSRLTFHRHIHGECSHDFDGVKPVPTEPRYTTVDECRQMREQYQQSDTTKQEIVEDFNVSEPTVRHHIHGRCSHDLDGIKPCPVNSSQTTADECRQMREQYQQSDITQQEIADTFNLGGPTVRHHIHGKCSHDLDGVKPCPVKSSHTTADECRQMREQYQQSDTTQQEIAEDFNRTKPTVNRHLNGRCNHE